MKVIRDFFSEKFKIKSSIVAVGVFDGFHLGHFLILKNLIQEAKKNKAKSVLVTFDVHPKKVYGHEFSGYITTREEKIQLLKESGVDYICYLPFEKISSLSAEAFVDLLKEKIGLLGFVLGEDFKCGHKASCGIDCLNNLGKTKNFSVKSIKRKTRSGKDISSSRIRDELKKGNLSEVKKILGREYSLRAFVEKGKRLGSSVLHVPTANVDVANMVIPPLGIYITSVLYNKKFYPAVSDLGTAPSLRQRGKPDKVLLETYILDKKIDLYGKEIEIIFHKYIRPEKYFADLESLKEQISKDIKQAKKYHSKRIKTAISS